MYEIVADLEDYPRFVPNCKAMVVRPDGASNTKLATMTLFFGPITQAYTSRVVLDPVAHTIKAKAVDGPFAYLDSVWSFEPEGMGTRVRFEVDFKISNVLNAAVAEPAFAAKQAEIIQAFVDEADRRYGD
jgi:coenzyme Q-binding protein COQ10